MTCPCGQYDYVDSTAKTLADAMAYHREHGNRIIHEKLTGSRLFRGMTVDPAEKEKDLANQMRLYLHSARCPVALRSFLDCNPNYWCFIPMSWHEALNEDMNYFQTRRIHSSSSSNATAITNAGIANTLALNVIDNQRAAHYYEHVPLPPAAYVFTYRQRQKQRLFFVQFLSTLIHQQPYSTLDLYQMKVIAILPDDRSIILRYIIETLFILHHETQLNMICPIRGDPQIRYGRAYNLV